MIRKTLLLVLALTLLAGFAFAGERGTPDEAKANVEAAVKFYNEVGKDKALAEFSNPAGKFIKGDLYIFAIALDGMTLAHGANQKLVGKSLYAVKDADGKLFMQEMIEVAKTKGKGWIDYKWQNPATKKIEPKTSYVVKLNDILIGCGAYK